MKAKFKKLITYEEGSYWFMGLGVLCVMVVLVVGGISLGNAYRLQARMQKAAEYAAQKCGEQAVEIASYPKGSKEQTAVMDKIVREAVKEYFKGEKVVDKMEIGHMRMKEDGKTTVLLSLYQRSGWRFLFGWKKGETQMEHQGVMLKSSASIIINKD